MFEGNTFAGGKRVSQHVAILDDALAKNNHFFVKENRKMISLYSVKKDNFLLFII